MDLESTTKNGRGAGDEDRGRDIDIKTALGGALRAITVTALIALVIAPPGAEGGQTPSDTPSVSVTERLLLECPLFDREVAPMTALETL